MRKHNLEPWAIDVMQRLIPLRMSKSELADFIKLSRSHMANTLNGIYRANERTKHQIIKAVEELEREAGIKS